MKPETLYLAVNNCTGHGFALGDTVCAVGMAWKFLRNDRPTQIIISLNKRGGEFNFLWDRFIRENPVEVVWDDFCPNNKWEKYSVFDHRRRERKVQGRPFDVYREINVRTESGARQAAICGGERGLTMKGVFGQFNLWTYYHCGQESYHVRPAGLHEFTSDLIDHPPWTPQPRSVLIAPHAKCQGNHVFTLDFWLRVVGLLLEHDPKIRIYLNTDHAHFSALADARLEKGLRGQAELFQRIPRYGAVACGNTGVGWVAAACGVPLFAMQPDDSYFEDFRYEWCGVKCLKQFFRRPQPMRVAQALLDHLNSLTNEDTRPMEPLTLEAAYPQEQALEAYVPAAGRVAVDVGCNAGHWTRVLASRFERVEAVDPQPDCVAAVQALALPNVRTHQWAAWSNNGELLFRRHENEFGQEQGAIAGVDGFIESRRVRGEYAVACRPLDGMGLARPVDFLKVDVDGAEMHAILGAQMLLRYDRPTLLIETHNEECRAFLMAYLPKFGYAPQLLGEMVVDDPARWNDRCLYFYAPRPAA